jgi:imidazolonepropionase
VSLTIKDAVFVTAPGAGPVRGDQMAELEMSQEADITCEDGVIAGIGKTGSAGVTLEAAGCTVLPGFVDCHTHLPFYGWRADEDMARLSGVRYETIHRQEGGIFRSKKLLEEATDEEIVDFGVQQAAAMLRAGTTTFETKSGYGLSVDGELRQLRLAAQVAELVPQSVVSTCLAAHAVPQGYTEGQWTGEVATSLIPQAAEQGLCSAVDIYVETIAFALEHAARLAETAKGLGLSMRIHADQLENGQSAAFAARWGFRSADHLNHTSLDAVDDLAASDTAAVLLPGATFTLRQNKKPPARDLIQSGAIVALGTDLNPGTSPLHSMPFVMALACRTYGLRPAEALVAATVNSAYVLGLEDRVGRIAPGYRADLVVIDSPFDHLVYRPDADLIAAVVCGGELVYARHDFKDRISN